MPTQQFRTTRWSTVLAAADRSSPGHPQALASLCEAYWYPLYCFVRRRSCDAAEAEELARDRGPARSVRDLVELARDVVDDVRDRAHPTR